MKKPYLGCIPSLADPRDYSLSVVADVEYRSRRAYIRSGQYRAVRNGGA